MSAKTCTHGAMTRIGSVASLVEQCGLHKQKNAAPAGTTSGVWSGSISLLSDAVGALPGIVLRRFNLLSGHCQLGQ
jgi:hypothetical protein